jgi:hypothetical protein
MSQQKSPILPGLGGGLFSGGVWSARLRCGADVLWSERCLGTGASNWQSRGAQGWRCWSSLRYLHRSLGRLLTCSTGNRQAQRSGLTGLCSASFQSCGHLSRRWQNGFVMCRMQMRAKRGARLVVCAFPARLSSHALHPDILCACWRLTPCLTEIVDDCPGTSDVRVLGWNEAASLMAA